MKISNWCKKACLAVVAAGWFVPESIAQVNIPLGDPSFEDFQVPTTSPAAGYAYAGIVATHYRPTSDWISRPGAGNYQDGGPHGSNWLYNAAYAESASPARKRAAPRTGNQSMHGRGFVSGQKLDAVFEAGRTYTFSMYAQGDDDALLLGPPFGWQSRVFLMIYDGSLYGNDVGPSGEDFEVLVQNSLTYDPDEYDPMSSDFTYFPHDRFAPDEPIPPDGTTIHPGDFVNRPVGASAAQSRAAWQQISVSWLVFPGSPEVGKPIGVAFQAFEDGAVDDASLSVLGPGDLDGDVDMDAADWNILRSSQHGDFTGLTDQEKYLAGDLNADGFNNHADFVLFKNAFDQANGPGSFVAMLTSVPEPSAVVIVCMGVALTAFVRRRDNE
jgi:hypothetical protein